MTCEGLWLYNMAVEPEKIYEELGEAIKRLRKEGGHTQAWLSSQAGISRASLANIEAGRQQILVHHIYKIASALQLDSPMQLLPTAPSRESLEASLPSLPFSDEKLTKSQREQIAGLVSKGMR